MLAGFDAKPLKRESRSQAKRSRAIGCTGVVEMFGGDTAPEGALLCLGQPVSRQAYADLYRVIGTRFGAGDGATTFNVPNMADRMPIGAGNLYAAAATGGSKDAIVVSHTHVVNDGGHGHGTNETPHSHFWGRNEQNGIGAGAGNLGQSGTGNAAATSSSSTGITIVSNTTGISLQNTGSTGTNANLPPYVGMNFIIWA